MEAKSRLFLNAARDKLVAEGHADAAFLYAAPGDEIPTEAAELFGLVDGDLPKKKAKAEGGPETKVEGAPAKKAEGGPGQKVEGGPAQKVEGQ